MKKRILSLLVALVLVFGTAVPALADGEAAAEESQGVSVFAEELLAEASAPALDGGSDAWTGWSMTDNVWYYYSSGSLRTGWLKYGGSWYYLDPDTGAMATGWRTVAGDGVYYLNASGAMLTGWQYLDGAWYYLDSAGRRVTGWKYSGGAWYYLDPDTGAMVTGWRTVDGADYYFFYENGAMAKGWQKLGDAWYYFASSGGQQFGWQYLGGAWYYLDPASGGAMVTGWQTIDGVDYYFSGSGAMASGWQRIDDGWYYFASSGVQQFGWQKLSGLWYYLDPEQSGRMLTGWQTIEDVTYFFWGNGRMSNMPTYIGGEMYYFTSDGALHTSTTLSRCGKTYDVDENGVIVGYVTPAMKQAASVLNSVGWDLWSAFKWSTSLTYYGRWLRAPSGAVHTEWYANYGFSNYCGNCYIINSTFYQMAKALGYDVYFVEGGVLNSSGYLAPHGWTEVVINGYAYVFDPEFQHATGMNGYQVWYGKSGTWRYSSYSRYYG